MKKPLTQPDFKMRCEIEHKEGWRSICNDMPFIEWGKGFEVAIIPPFSGATARMLVRKKHKQTRVSIYCDHFNALGYMDKPYFEIYAGTDDCERFFLDEANAMRDRVHQILNGSN